MGVLILREFHEGRGARFARVRDVEVVADYGDWRAEHRRLVDGVGLLDLSMRGRVVLLGADRQKMLNGQVTNDVKALGVGEGCYAALVNAKARMLSDLHIYALPQELLLDCEPGLGGVVIERLEKFVVGEDVQVVDAGPHYGLLTVQGPRARTVIERSGIVPKIPEREGGVESATHGALGEIYLANQPRTGTRGYDVYGPNGTLAALAGVLTEVAGSMGGGWCGWEALEVARVEAGIPRYGMDMDETNLPPEAGIEERAISYRKGCYVGQEVIARIRTYGQVAKALRGLRLSGVGQGEGAPVPERGTKLYRDGREAGYLTSVVWSPRCESHVALGYVRKETNQPGAELAVGSADAGVRAVVVALPFVGRCLA